MTTCVYLIEDDKVYIAADNRVTGGNNILSNNYSKIYEENGWIVIAAGGVTSTINLTNFIKNIKPKNYTKTEFLEIVLNSNYPITVNSNDDSIAICMALNSKREVVFIGHLSLDANVNEDSSDIHAFKLSNTAYAIGSGSKFATAAIHTLEYTDYNAEEKIAIIMDVAHKNDIATGATYDIIYAPLSPKFDDVS